MINANELRIGNLVYFNGNHNHIGTVSGLGNKSILKYHYIEYEKELKVFLNNRYDIPYSPLNLKPIPLTEEWLLKLGFRTEESSCFELDDIHINTSRELMWVFTKCKNNIEMEMPEFVYQLQNLYFALTNKELTLNK